MTESAIVRDVLPNGLRLLTERMPHVRSVSIGVWLARGSRHEPQEQGGIAHFVEHMLFKGTATRSGRGHRPGDRLHRRPDGRLHRQGVRQLLHQGPRRASAVCPRGAVGHRDEPAVQPDDIEREKKVVLEEIKMVEDTPDDLVHELFTENFWADHPLGRPILGTKETVESLIPTAAPLLRAPTTAPNLIVAAVGNVEHAQVRDLVARTFEPLPTRRRRCRETARRASFRARSSATRSWSRATSVSGTAATAGSPDRYSSYVMNTVLGGSMSSRLFQNVREKRGLAYAVFSGLSAYRDTGSMTIYAGCANDAVGELIDVVIAELRRMKDEPLPDAELRRAKDHLKGSLMLNLESTSSRMSHLARQEIYFDRQFGLDETLEGVERVTPDDIQRVARDLFATDRWRDRARRGQRPADSEGATVARWTPQGVDDADR